MWKRCKMAREDMIRESWRVRMLAQMRVLVSIFPAFLIVLVLTLLLPVRQLGAVSLIHPLVLRLHGKLAIALLLLGAPLGISLSALAQPVPLEEYVGRRIAILAGRSAGVMLMCILGSRRRWRLGPWRWTPGQGSRGIRAGLIEIFLADLKSAVLCDRV